MKQVFIGFADSDKFLDAVDRSKPVNLSISRRTGKPDKRYGMSIDATLLTMSQVQGAEVFYFEHATHRYQCIRGDYFGNDPEKVSRLADQVRDAVTQYLNDKGVTWREALVAMPVSYVKLDGHATFLKWDEESKSYSYLKLDEVRNE